MSSFQIFENREITEVVKKRLNVIFFPLVVVEKTDKSIFLQIFSPAEFRLEVMFCSFSKAQEMWPIFGENQQRFYSRNCMFEIG